MKENFKNRFWRGCRWMAGAFLLMFLFRLLYGYVVVDSSTNGSPVNDFFSSVAVRKNYASEKMQPSGGTPDLQQQVSKASSQKYERTADLRTKTNQFETDGMTLRQRTTAFGGVVQYEQNRGNEGARELHLVVGVVPERFDSFCVQVQQIGKIQVREITKVDKTNEYRQLNAKKTSLEKTLASLNELKSRGGNINDYVALHDKILAVESELQGLGVELGNFDTENEFCTVRFSLYEGAATKSISLLHRIKVALEWTLQYFALLLFVAVAGAVFVLVVLLVIDRLRAL